MPPDTTDRHRASAPKADAAAHRAKVERKELAEERTELAAEREDLAEERTEWAADRSVLANERTYTAWVRTGLAALVAGLATLRFMETVLPTWSLKPVAAALIVYSLFCFAAGVWRYRKTDRRLARRGARRPIGPLALAGATAVLAGAALTALVSVWFV